MKKSKLYWRFTFHVYNENQVRLNWSYLKSKPQNKLNLPEDTLSDEYKLRLIQEKEDKILAEKVLHKNLPTGNQTMKEFLLSGIIQFNLDATHVLLLYKEREIFRLKVPPNNSKLMVPFKSHTPRGKRKIKWQYKSDVPQNTWFRIFLILDNGKKLPISEIIREPEYLIDFSLLPGCKKGSIVITMSDGFWTREFLIENLYIPYKKPITEIIYPGQNQQVESDDFLELQGQGWDEQEQSFIPSNKLLWTLDDKKIGYGNLQLIMGVKPGKHKIRLQSENSVGFKSDATVEIISSKGPYPKIVKIKK